MKNRQEDVHTFLAGQKGSYTAKEIAEALNLDRANVSRYLNELYKEKRIKKSSGRPVRYQQKAIEEVRTIKEGESLAFSHLIGHDASLKVMIQQAKAAILYPPRGLHTIIFGKTGTGKSLFAECMHRFALESEALPQNAPFVSFNCADYAQNPQLLFSHIFGMKKGSYTGADENRTGLIHEADGGILFLDEIHRLPPEGQEMLFTFIDKGLYRPLGESSETYTASVQIIGATTESSEVLLSTFNRRIPMTITLPALAERTIEERYELLETFLQQEAQRLNQKIVVERDVLLAFMLYHAEGNIGQVQRDLKLVCAKAFLHYRTHDEQHLTIVQKDLPLGVQKGLLLVKEVPAQMERLIKNREKHFSYTPSSQTPENLKDFVSDMSVYNVIEERVNEALKSQDPLGEIDLEELIQQKDLTKYFNDYVQRLSSMSDVHQELITEKIKNLTDHLYDLAEERLHRTYQPKSRFAFALHLQSTIERINENRQIIHPNLNEIRKKHSKEFQAAIDLSAVIEGQYAIEIPFDEIGFITMFLTIEDQEVVQDLEKQTAVMILMHGKSTASSMLETVQELLDTTAGVAVDMPLTMRVKEMYENVRRIIEDNRDRYEAGLLLLTDMGSLTSFGNMLEEELGVRIKSLSMVSTPIVLEAVRMASVGRTLEDIYQSCQRALENNSRQNVATEQKKRPAILVTCFTGEGVAKKLEERIRPVIDETKTDIIPLQFFHREAFKQHIDQLMEHYEIKAIVGTVEFDYQNIPYFSAYEIFNDENLMILKNQIEAELPVDQMIQSLEGTLKNVGSVEQLVLLLQKMVHQLENQMNIVVAAGVKTGLILHLAFLVEGMRNGTLLRTFPFLTEYVKKNRISIDLVKAALIPLEKQYQVVVPEDEVAYIVQMFMENQLTLR